MSLACVKYREQDVAQSEEPERNEGVKEVNFPFINDSKSQVEEASRKKEEQFEEEVDIDVVVLLRVSILNLPELKEAKRTDQKEVDGAEKNERKKQEEGAAVRVFEIDGSSCSELHEGKLTLVGRGSEEEPHQNRESHGGK